MYVEWKVAVVMIWRLANSQAAGDVCRRESGNNLAFSKFTGGGNGTGHARRDRPEGRSD